MATVGQSGPLFSELRVRDHWNLLRSMSGAKFRKYGRPPARVSWRKIATLSGGEERLLQLALLKARSGLALALLDEPARALDKENTSEIMSAIEQLATGGVGLLLAEQRLEFASQMADRLVLLHQGSLVDLPG